MRKHISIPRSVFVLLVAAPLLLGARAVASHLTPSVAPAIFSAGNRVRDDKQREFDIIRVDGEWAQIRLRSNGPTTILSQPVIWLHIPTNNMYTLQ